MQCESLSNLYSAAISIAQLAEITQLDTQIGPNTSLVLTFKPTVMLRRLASLSMACISLREVVLARYLSIKRCMGISILVVS
jgi:hypothetical protein